MCISRGSWVSTTQPHSRLLLPTILLQKSMYLRRKKKKYLYKYSISTKIKIRKLSAQKNVQTCFQQNSKDNSCQQLDKSKKDIPCAKKNQETHQARAIHGTALVILASFVTFIIWASSMMNLPSLYFWLLS